MPTQYKQLEQTNTPKPVDLHAIDTAYKVVSIPESANFGTIFGFHYFRALNILLTAPFRFIFFPFAAVCGITKATLGWYRFHHDHKGKETIDKKSLILNIWETISATVTTTAVTLGATGAIIGVSAATSAVIGMTISLMFTVSLGLTTLLHAGFATYHLVKALNKNTPGEEKAGHRAAAKGHAIATGILAMLTISVVIAMVVGSLVIGGAIGAATCAVSVGLGLHDLYTHLQSKKTAKAATILDRPSSTAQMYDMLTPGKPVATLTPSEPIVAAPTTTPGEQPAVVAAAAAPTTPGKPAANDCWLDVADALDVVTATPSLRQ